MKRMRIYLGIMIIICLMGLPGCGHIIRWAESNFDQGQNMEPVSKVPRTYMRSAQVHRQFSTVALIDALWLSDEVRTIYSNIYGLKNGKNDAMIKAFLRRQLEENKHFISFYVLTNFSLNMGDQNNTWAVFLQVGDIVMAPNEIRTTDLTPEFKSFFGKRYNRFKSVYLIKFNAKTVDGQSVIAEDSHSMELYFRSLEKEAVLIWPLTPEGEMLPVPSPFIPEMNDDKELPSIEEVPA